MRLFSLIARLEQSTIYLCICISPSRTSYGGIISVNSRCSELLSKVDVFKMQCYRLRRNSTFVAATIVGGTGGMRMLDGETDVEM